MFCRILVVKGRHDITIFQNASSGPLKKAWERKVRPFVKQLADSITQSIQQLLDHSDATLFLNPQEAMATNAYRNCKLTPIPGDYIPGYLTFAVQTDSPYKEIINYFLRKLTEDGSITRSELKYFARSKLKCLGDHLNGQSMGLNITISAIIIMIVGIIVSAILFIIEIIRR